MKETNFQECEIIGDNVQTKELEIKGGDYCIEKKS